MIWQTEDIKVDHIKAICMSCGGRFDVHISKSDSLQMSPNGILYGMCPKCKSQREAVKNEQCKQFTDRRNYD